MSRLRALIFCLLFATLPAPAANLAVVNAASFMAALAPGSIAAAFGSDLAVGTGARTAVTVQDSTGTVGAATLFCGSGGRSLRIRFRTWATSATGDVAGRDGAVRCSQLEHAVPTALTPAACM